MVKKTKAKKEIKKRVRLTEAASNEKKANCDDRRRVVMERLTLGRSRVDIAKELGVSYATICNDVKIMKEGLPDADPVEGEGAVEQFLEFDRQYLLIILCALENRQIALAGAEGATSTTKKRGNKSNVPSKLDINEANRALDIALKAMAQRATLWGVNDDESYQGSAEAEKSLAEMTDDELEREIAEAIKGTFRFN